MALAAVIPALLATILMFMDQQITAVIVNRKDHKMKVCVACQECNEFMQYYFMKIDHYSNQTRRHVGIIGITNCGGLVDKAPASTYLLRV